MAYKKICPDCKKASFCASRNVRWICPYCDKDITEIEVESMMEKSSNVHNE